LTAREKVYGAGQSKLRDDHTGSKYKYDVYEEEARYVAEENGGETSNGVETSNGTPIGKLNGKGIEKVNGKTEIAV